MKQLFKILAFAIVIGSAFESCNKSFLYEGSSTEEGEPEYADIPFCVKGCPVETKSISEDSTVFQVLVYNSSNKLVGYAATDSGKVSLHLPIGVSGHKVYVCVNYQQDLSSCETPTALLGKASQLKLISSKGVEMFGSLENQTFSASTPVNVTVTRFVSTVSVKKIVSNLPGSAYSNTSFAVKGIYLTNVVGSTCYDGTMPKDSVWYNPMGKVSGEADALITKTYSMPYELQTSEGIKNDMNNINKEYYCYANPTTVDSRSSTFSARKTRLVIETKLGNDTYYYPIDICDPTTGKLERNTKYVITSLTISGPGVSSPEEQISRGTVSFTVKVAPWNDTVSSTVEY